jgi:hypothetical protein
VPWVKTNKALITKCRSQGRAALAYRHLRGLGTPKPGRDAARGGDLAGFKRIFLAHLREPEAVLDFGEAVALAEAKTVCLLYLERDPEQCHRLIVGNRMAAATGPAAPASVRGTGVKGRAFESFLANIFCFGLAPGLRRDIAQLGAAVETKHSFPRPLRAEPPPFSRG